MSILDASEPPDNSRIILTIITPQDAVAGASTITVGLVRTPLASYSNVRELMGVEVYIVGQSLLTVMK